MLAISVRKSSIGAVASGVVDSSGIIVSFFLVITSSCGSVIRSVDWQDEPLHQVEASVGVLATYSHEPLFLRACQFSSEVLRLGVGTHGWVARICQPWEQSHLVAGCQKWKLLDVGGTQPPFSDAVVK